MLFFGDVYIFLCAQLFLFARSLHGFTLVYALTCRCTGTCRSCVILRLYLFTPLFTLYLEVPRQTGYFMPTRCGEVKPEASGPFTLSLRGAAGVSKAVLFIGGGCRGARDERIGSSERLVLGRDTLEKGLQPYDKLAHRVLERNVLRHASPGQVVRAARPRSGGGRGGAPRPSAAARPAAPAATPAYN
jgi:hypothetical protein